MQFNWFGVYGTVHHVKLRLGAAVCGLHYKGKRPNSVLLYKDEIHALSIMPAAECKKYLAHISKAMVSVNSDESEGN